jgi:hypothetical protein
MTLLSASLLCFLIVTKFISLASPFAALWVCISALLSLLLIIGRRVKMKRALSAQLTKQSLLLEHRLKEALFAQRLEGAEPDDSRVRLVREQVFAQEYSEALVALRQRFEHPPEPRYLIDIFVERLIANYRLSVALPLLWALVTIPAVYFYFGLWWVIFSMIFVPLVAMCVLCLIVIETLWYQQDEFDKHQTFSTQVARVESLAELAGALTLAADEPDALVGALSPDEQGSGSLEMCDVSQRAH